MSGVPWRVAPVAGTPSGRCYHAPALTSSSVAVETPLTRVSHTSLTITLSFSERARKPTPDSYRKLASAVVQQAAIDAGLIKNSEVTMHGRLRRFTLPERMNARDRFVVESARVWLTKTGPGMELWCGLLEVEPEVLVRRARRLLRERLRLEHKRRAQVVIVACVVVA